MFDLDGTLIDTMGHFADLAASIVEREYALDWALARRRYLQTSGVPFRQQLETIFPGDQRNDRASEIYERRKTAICTRAVLDAQALACLRRLRANDIAVVLSSNSAQHFVDEFAARTPFAFDLVMGFGNGLAKGAPHVAHVAQQLGVASDRVLFVGDSLKDAELASACGQRFVGVAGTFAAADFTARFPATPVVEHVRDLPDLLGMRG